MASGKTVAIHQPNFFPWLGYFDKIARSDVFVMLDDVQNVKTGSSWTNRVRLLCGGEARWVTAPLRRPAHGTERIADVRCAEGPWRAKLLASLQVNYGRCAYYAEAMTLLRPLIEDPEPSLATYNVRAITAIALRLSLAAEMRLASRLAAEGAGNERLAALVRAVGCDTYLVGGGAQGYRDDSVFTTAGLRVEEQAFVHPQYSQRGRTGFIPGLSVIDALMNCGIEGTRKLLVHA